MILDPLVELTLQTILLFSVIAILRQVHDFVGIILKIVELFTPISVEIVFPLGCSNGSNGVYPGLFTVVLGNDVVALRSASVASRARWRAG